VLQIFPVLHYSVRGHAETQSVCMCNKEIKYVLTIVCGQLSVTSREKEMKTVYIWNYSVHKLYLRFFSRDLKKGRIICE